MKSKSLPLEKILNYLSTWKTSHPEGPAVEVEDDVQEETSGSDGPLMHPSQLKIKISD